MKEIVVLNASHIEAARQVASGATWREIGETFQLPNRVIHLWRTSKALSAKIEEYRRALSDKGALTPKEAARVILESKAVEAAEKLGDLMVHGTQKQQLDAARDILDRTGVVLTERVGQIVINLSAKDMMETERDAMNMGLIEASERTRKLIAPETPCP